MALEMTLVRLARRPALLSLDELLARLGDLEKRLGSGPPVPPRASGAAGASSRGGGAAKGGGPLSSPPVLSRGNLTSGTLALASPPPEPTTSSLLLHREPVEITPTPPPNSTLVALRVEPLATEPVPLGSAWNAQTPGHGEPQSEPLAVWRAILHAIAQTRPSLGAVFQHAAILELTPERAIFGFESQSFAGAQARDPEALEILTREIRAYFGKVTYVAIDHLAPKASVSQSATIASIDAAKRKENSDRARASVRTHPLVLEAVRLFGAELQEVRIREDEE
jgi:DNA polymerase-3 subunit gamma/tau